MLYGARGSARQISRAGFQAPFQKNRQQKQESHPEWAAAKAASDESKTRLGLSQASIQTGLRQNQDIDQIQLSNIQD